MAAEGALPGLAASRRRGQGRSPGDARASPAPGVRVSRQPVRSPKVGFEQESLKQDPTKRLKYIFSFLEFLPRSCINPALVINSSRATRWLCSDETLAHFQNPSSKISPNLIFSLRCAPSQGEGEKPYRSVTSRSALLRRRLNSPLRFGWQFPRRNYREEWWMLMYDVAMILPSHSIQFPPLHVVLRQKPWKMTVKWDSLY